MNCSEVNNLLHLLVDDELSGDLHNRTKQHLVQCRHCTNKLSSLEQLKVRIREVPTASIPPQLKSKISASLPTNDDEPERMVRRWSNLLFLFPSHVLAMILGGIIFSALLSMQSVNDNLDDDVLSAHIRSLMENEIIQVASADTHTVAPWFAGKINFAPTVPDLSSDGFILLGGRIDSTKSRQFAALAYQRRKHIISLFASLRLDNTKQSSPVQQWKRRGYNVVQWSDPEFNYTAISDLSASEMMQFSILIRN